MDKKFWQAVKENKYALPAEHSAAQLTEELFSYLGSPDPELRDSIAYEILANWLNQELYPPDQLRAYILRLILNLQDGLGEPDSDSVFQRSFSALYLAEIINYENKHAFLDKDELQDVFARTLEYLESEQDPRGYVADKGWAHALAHTADLLYVLAENRHLGRAELHRLLDGIRSKLLRPTDWVYIHGEDDRLVRAVTAVFERKLIDAASLQAWLMSFAIPESGSWKDSFEVEKLQKAFFNAKTFLSSLYLKLAQSGSADSSSSWLPGILDALRSLSQF